MIDLDKYKLELRQLIQQAKLNDNVELSKLAHKLSGKLDIYYEVVELDIDDKLKHIKEWMNTFALYTGSNKFYNKTDSDFDYVVEFDQLTYIDDTFEYCAQLITNNTSDYNPDKNTELSFTSWCEIIEGDKINVIIVKKGQRKVWEEATREFQEIIDNDPVQYELMKVKENRVTLFEKLRTKYDVDRKWHL